VPVPAVLHQLRAAGVAAADAFLEAHLGQVGTESSVDLRAMFG
jgi:NTE family protein